MRISDWSSDVCSSDLGDRGRPGQQAAVGDREPEDARVEVRHTVHVRHEQAEMAERERCLRHETSFRLRVLCGRSDEARWAPAFTSDASRSEEHTSELPSLMRISYAVFCLKKKKTKHTRMQEDDT